ncbi:MAG: hypothetical protein VX593_02140, partial [Pseudomonadota bacterium]|nr:hypothetical protein [Pseudomonadota bacterium]
RRWEYIMKYVAISACFFAALSFSASADDFVDNCTSNKPDAISDEEAVAICECIADKTEDTPDIRDELSKSGKGDDV